MIPHQEENDFYLEEGDARYRMIRHAQSYPSSPEVSQFRWLFELSRKENPGISIDEQVLGGIPHIENTRLSVGQILGRLYSLGSVCDVAKYYDELSLSEDQVREAISFAQEFVELAGDPYQPYD